MSSAVPTPTTVKALTQEVLQSNKDHQYALKVYTERLEAELEAVDKLLAAAETPEDEPDVDVGGNITLENAIKPSGPIPSDISPTDHPFADDVAKRRKYLQLTTIHPMKSSDLEVLADAVRSENHRIYALQAQQRGQQPLVVPADHPQGFFEVNKEGINWERVAQKVSSAGSNAVHRTAQECAIRWLGERHPEFDRSSWSPAELAKVKELVGDAKEGEIDWVEIAAKLGTKRTPIDCMRHAIPRKQHVWTPESDKKLIELVQIYGTENWLLVARQISEDATAAQCQNRYTRTLDPQLRRGPWTPEEDAQLKRAVDVFGRSWVEVSMFVPTRSNEQCRERWQEVLNPHVGRGRWTEEEDRDLLKVYSEVGDKWKELSMRLGTGRTDNMCRHRVGLLMKRKAQAGVASPAPQDSGVSTPTSEPVAGPSQPRKRGRPRNQPQSEAEPMDDAQPSPEDSSTPAPSKPKPKPKPRPRAKRKEAQQAGVVAGGTTTTEGEAGLGAASAEAGADTQQEVAQQADVEASGEGAAGNSEQTPADHPLVEDPADEPIAGPGSEPPQRGRGRPRGSGRGRGGRGGRGRGSGLKRTQAERLDEHENPASSETPAERPAKKRRTGKDAEPTVAGTSTAVPQEPTDPQGVEDEADARGKEEASEAAPVTEVDLAAEGVRATKPTRGRKKRADPPPRPAGTRQSARLRASRT